jgi:hypothetical protein
LYTIAYAAPNLIFGALQNNKKLCDSVDSTAVSPFHTQHIKIALPKKRPD